jgi:hypothetical protein
MKKWVVFFSFCLMVNVFYSCQKNEVLDTIDETAISQQEAQADQLLTEVDLLVDEAINLNLIQFKSALTNSSAYLGECPTNTVNKTTTPQVMTIDFGTSCTGKDGKIRSGKILVTATSFKIFPSERTKTFENFYVDGKKIEGTAIKTLSKDRENNIQTAIINEDLTIIFPDDAGSASRVSTFTRLYYLNEIGNTTDNQVVSWGTVETTRPSGLILTKTIKETDPLVFKAECKQVVSGTVLFSNSKGQNWTLNYGTGDCDNIATLTKGDKVKEITLK